MCPTAGLTFGSGPGEKRSTSPTPSPIHATTLQKEGERAPNVLEQKERQERAAKDQTGGTVSSSSIHHPSYSQGQAEAGESLRQPEETSPLNKQIREGKGREPTLPHPHTTPSPSVIPPDIPRRLREEDVKFDVSMSNCLKINNK